MRATRTHSRSVHTVQCAFMIGFRRSPSGLSRWRNAFGEMIAHLSYPVEDATLAIILCTHSHSQLRVCLFRYLIHKRIIQMK